MKGVEVEITPEVVCEEDEYHIRVLVTGEVDISELYRKIKEKFGEDIYDYKLCRALENDLRLNGSLRALEGKAVLEEEVEFYEFTEEKLKEALETLITKTKDDIVKLERFWRFLNTIKLYEKPLPL